jgi:hypothetical protein
VRRIGAGATLAPAAPAPPAAAVQPAAAPAAVGSVAAPTGPGLRTEFAFELPRGYLDQDGVVHRQGTMRLATARDELLPLYDGRVKERPAYLSVVLLARVVTRLGEVEVTDWVIENLFASDLAFLQDLYRRVNQEGHTRAALVCPACEHGFTVDVAGRGTDGVHDALDGRLGGS